MPTKTKTKAKRKRKSVKPQVECRESMMTFAKHEWRSIRDDFMLAARWCHNNQRLDDSRWLGQFVQGIVTEIQEAHKQAKDGDRITLRRAVDDWGRSVGLVQKTQWRGVIWPEFCRQWSAAMTEDW